MAELERIGRRIETATDLQSVVRTMKTLSAVGITQYEEAAQAISNYAETVERGLQVALRAAPGVAAAPGGADGATALVVVGSDFGLCGTFNEELVREARARFGAGGLEGEGLRILVAGQRLEQYWRAEVGPPDATMALPSSLGRLGRAAGDVLRLLDRWQEEAGVVRILLLHQAGDGEGGRDRRLVRVAPVTAADLAEIAARPWPTRALPMAESAPGPLFRALVRQRIFTRIYAAAALSRAAEHAARLAAMRAAESNISEKLGELRAAYRHRRQETITRELLDVVAGFEAARGAD